MNIHIDTNLMLTIALGIIIGLILLQLVRWLAGKISR